MMVFDTKAQTYEDKKIEKHLAINDCIKEF